MNRPPNRSNGQNSTIKFYPNSLVSTSKNLLAFEIQLVILCILPYQSYLPIHIISINFNCLDNSNFCHNHFHSNHYSCQINQHPNGSLLYHKLSKINNINIYIDFNTQIRITKELITINYCLTRSLQFGINQKNSHNLINYTKIRINLIE